MGPVGIAARYGFIDATFRTDFVAHSPANSSADANGDIVVASGNRIPGIPQHTLRVRLDFAASEALTLRRQPRGHSGVSMPAATRTTRTRTASCPAMPC